MKDFNERMVSRRSLLTIAGLGAMATASGCMNSSRASIASLTAFSGGGEYGNPQYKAMYGQIVDHGEVIPAVNPARVQEQFLRREVADPTGEAPGTVVVDTNAKFAYLRHARRTRHALRRRRRARGLRLERPRQGAVQEGLADLDAAERNDRSQARSGRIPPRHARRHHATRSARVRCICSRTAATRSTACTARRNTGRSAPIDSSGCIRFMNQDIIDLYDRVKPGTPVLVQAGVYV